MKSYSEYKQTNKKSAHTTYVVEIPSVRLTLVVANYAIKHQAMPNNQTIWLLYLPACEL